MDHKPFHAEAAPHILSKFMTAKKRTDKKSSNDHYQSTESSISHFKIPACPGGAEQVFTLDGLFFNYFIPGAWYHASDREQVKNIISPGEITDHYLEELYPGTKSNTSLF